MKLYSPIEVLEELKKALHRCIAKADPVLMAALKDLDDKNAVAELPKDEIPKATPKGVMYKAMKDTVMPNPPQPEQQSQPRPPGAPKPTMPPKPKLATPPGMGKTELPLASFLKKREDKTKC